MGALIELTDNEWNLVEDLFDPSVHLGVKASIPRREIIDAILWIARTGCQWRYLPARFPSNRRRTSRIHGRVFGSFRLRLGRRGVITGSE